MMPIEEPVSSWCINTEPSRVSEHLILGLVLNPEKAFEPLDKGPQANEEEAEDFRNFWGEKSELRRFQDGSITEACVWCSSSESLSNKRTIVRRIIDHLLEHHLKVSSKEFHYIANELDVAFKLNKVFKTERLHQKFVIDQNTDAEMATVGVIRSFDDLGRKLRTIKELPLDITSISGISPIFRYCDPVPCVPQARLINEKLHSDKVHKGVIQLGKF